MNSLPAIPLNAWSGRDLKQAAQGCTEHSCLYHGEFNREIARRKKEAA